MNGLKPYLASAALIALAIGTPQYVLAQSTDGADAGEVAAEIDAAYREAVDAGLLPPGAKPGECYARVYIPGTEKEIERQVLVKQAATRLEVVPAVYETIEEVVEVEGPTQELEIIPAVYETQTKTVVLEPEREDIETLEAEYEEVEERVKIREAYTTWKKGEGPIQRYDEATGEIMCLVTVPAEYETVVKRVVRNEARTVKTTVPAVTQVVEVKVMVEPPKTRTIEIPAKTQTIEVKKLVTAASVETVEIPAVYETVTETVKGDAGRMEWRPILCSTNASEDLIKRMQIALQEAGYAPGGVDGVLGGGTMEAVRRYQRANGIAQGQVTIETLEMLGVSIR